jgi:hypothetical protein
MGINVKQHEDKKTITALDAHALYLNIGGKRSYCRCKGDCSKSRSCKCKKNNKLCTKYCHNKQENLLCQLCTMEHE